MRTSCAGVQQQSGEEIRLTHLTHLRTDSSSTSGAIICTRLSSLTPHSSERNGPRCPTLQSHLRTQCEPFGTLHSASAVPRTGTLSLTCHGVLVVFDSYSTSNAQLLGAVERQRLRGQISRIWPSPHPTGLHPSPLAAKDVSCARVSPTQGCVLHPPLVVACNCHKRVVPEVSEPALESESFSSNLHRSVQLTFARRKCAFCLLDQNLKSPPLWTSIPPLTERLSPRFAAQSLSVYAIMCSSGIASKWSVAQAEIGPLS